MDPFFRLNEEHFTFHYSINILVRSLTVKMKNCLSPKNLKMCDPILATLLKVQPIIVNPVVKLKCDPIQRHIPLASCKEVTPPPPPPVLFVPKRQKPVAWVAGYSIGA